MTFSKVVREDLDIGTGTRQLRLQDGSLVTANQLQLSSLLVLATRRINATLLANALTLGSMIPAGAMVAGVTTEILIAIGQSQGLGSITIGDGTIMDRWGVQTDLTQGAQTDQGDFQPGPWPIYPTATDVVISAIDGKFDSVGQIEVTVHYFLLPHRAA